MNPIQVAAAIITRGDGKVLIARRAPHKNEGGFWEFPGGKLEVSETPEACLKREISEELALDVKVGRFFRENLHRYGNREILLKAYFCEYISGDIKLVDHDQVAWVNRQDLGQYEFAPADVPIVKSLA
jgi:8-oxo-dGTP diphosphatase